MRKKYLLSSLLLLTPLCYGKGCCGSKICAAQQTALSLEAQCQSIEATIELIQENCCGGGGECVCTPTPITGGASPIVLSAPGAYCLEVDLPTTDINPQPGVVLDLNGHTVLNVFGSNNFTVKNGTILNQLAGLENIVASRVQVSLVSGASGQPSNITLIDVTGIERLQGIQHLLMVRCSDGDLGSPVNAGVQDAIIYDSSFKNELLFNQDSIALQRLQLYQSSFGGVNVPDVPLLAPALVGVLVYKSVLNHLYLTSPGADVVRMIVEASDLGDLELGTITGSPILFSGLVTRSQLNMALCKQCLGVTFNQCQMLGETSFDTCENIECDNVSVNVADGNCFVVDNGRSITLRDCFATTRSVVPGDAGYSFNGTTTALEVLRCCAKSCPIGFYANNPTNGCAGIIKECLADGCTQSSFSLSNAQANLFVYGNVAISNAGVPAANYNPLALSKFNPVVTSLSAITTDTVTSWRNISFQRP